MKSYIISFTLLLVLSACGNKNQHSKMEVADIRLLPPPPVSQAKKSDADMTYADKEPSADHKPVDTAQKLVKDGDIRFQAGDLKSTKQKIVTSLKGFGGYVYDESELNNSDNNQREFNLKIRVPSKNFDRFLDALSGAADRIDSKNIRVKDVTAEYIDVTTQLKNKKLLENRYQQLLVKATKMADLLEIENKLTEIRSDVESTQGQLNYLNKQVAFSTLDITFYTKQSGQVNSGNEFGYKFKTALADGWSFLQNLFFGFISVWPIIIIVVLLVLMYKRWKQRKAKRNNS